MAEKKGSPALGERIASGNNPSFKRVLGFVERGQITESDRAQYQKNYKRFQRISRAVKERHLGMWGASIGETVIFRPSLKQLEKEIEEIYGQEGRLAYIGEVVPKRRG